MMITLEIVVYKLMEFHKGPMLKTIGYSLLSARAKYPKRPRNLAFFTVSTSS